MRRRFFEHHGSDPEDEFQLLVALLERGLMLVGFKRILQGELPVVCDQGEDAVGAGLIEQGLGVRAPVQHGALIGLTDIGGAGAWTARVAWMKCSCSMRATSMWMKRGMGPTMSGDT